MRLFDRLFTRRRRIPAFARLPQRVRKRLASACGELDAAEAEIAEALDLPQPPRLPMPSRCLRPRPPLQPRPPSMFSLFRCPLAPFVTVTGSVLCLATMAER